MCGAGISVRGPAEGTEEQSLPDGQTLSAYTRVDLNTADVDALCTLPGVGESRARAIMAYRQQYGPFAQVQMRQTFRA